MIEGRKKQNPQEREKKKWKKKHESERTIYFGNAKKKERENAS